MKTYEKPMIIKVEDVAESVYMASGTAGGGSTGNDIKVNARVTGSDGQRKIWFSGDVTNMSSEPVSDWKAVIQFDGAIDSATVSNCNVSINGSTLTITPAESWNKSINANGNQVFSGEVESKDRVLSIIS